MHTPCVGWCPSGHSSLTEDEPTKKVPDYLVALAMSLEDDTDSQTMPMCGVATNTLEAFEALEATELNQASDWLDHLESERPAPASTPIHQVHQSGVVPAGTSVPREVIPPPPPRRPSVPTFAFAATLDAFSAADVPFHAEADNQQVAVKSGPRAAAMRAAVSRCIASAVLALVALLVLIVIGGRPLIRVQPAARTAVTLRARAERSDPTGTARSAVRATPALVAKTPRFHARPAPTRLAKTPGAPSHIIRTSPF